MDTITDIPPAPNDLSSTEPPARIAPNTSAGATSSEINDAARALGMHKFSARKLQSLNLLGEVVSKSNPIHTGRAWLMVGFDQALQILTDASNVDGVSSENRIELLKVRKDVVKEMVSAGKTMIGSDRENPNGGQGGGPQGLPPMPHSDSRPVNAVQVILNNSINPNNGGQTTNATHEHRNPMDPAAGT